MSQTIIISETQEIIRDNMDYTLFSWSKQSGINPIAIQRGEGVYLYDCDGKRYLDGLGGIVTQVSSASWQ